MTFHRKSLELVGRAVLSENYESYEVYEFNEAYESYEKVFQSEFGDELIWFQVFSWSYEHSYKS